MGSIRPAFNRAMLFGTSDPPKSLKSVTGRYRRGRQNGIPKTLPGRREYRILAGAILQVIRQTLLSFEQTAKNQEVLHGEILRYFNAMTVAREQRLSVVSSSIPDVLWYVVIIGEQMVGGSFPAPLHPAASQVYRDLGLVK